ncbi:MAG: VWA domain-containing protein [Bryobacteraceae bacterium]
MRARTFHSVAGPAAVLLLLHCITAGPARGEDPPKPESGSAPAAPAAPESDVVFRSDVSLVRVDVQVLDRGNRAVAGLDAEDFILEEEGRPREIRNFVREDMPVDVLFLLDVSGSMRMNIERVATASHRAFQVLGPNDRVAVMVFDRMTRVRSGFRPQREGPRELDDVIRQESFNGGTDILRALLDATRYMERSARREARRAIIIVTDDQTEFDRDDRRVGRALTQSDTVLFALLAPNVMGPGRGRGGNYPTSRRGRYPGGGWPGGGGGWPGTGGGWPIPWPGGGGGGGNYPVPTGRGGGTQSGGSPEIARESGGDSFPVDSATSLETTLERLRQRYALHFVVPDGVKQGEERSIDVRLAASASRRYPGAELRYRRVYLAPATTDATPAEISEDRSVSKAEDQSGGWRRAEKRPGDEADHDSEPKFSRRPPVNETSGPRGPMTGDDPASIRNSGPASDGAWTPIEQKQSGGWRTATPEEVDKAGRNKSDQ